MTRYRKGGVYIVRDILETLENKKIFYYWTKLSNVFSQNDPTSTNRPFLEKFHANLGHYFPYKKY